MADLRAMASAARKAGARLAIQSAYRSYTTQKSTFAYWVRVSGYSAAIRSSARAGHSEHQLGTTIDFRSYGGSAPWYYSDWGKSKAGAWLRANAWKYGFVMSYPKGKTSVTCYAYEPWHFRYVGRSRGGQDPGERTDPARVPVAGAERTAHRRRPRPRSRRRANRARPRSRRRASRRLPNRRLAPPSDQPEPVVEASPGA